ncbi:MAG: hypothetical protein WCP97_07790, partial [bacterium]
DQLTGEQPATRMPKAQPLDSSKMQMPLFATTTEESAILQELEMMDINALTPIEALTKLDEIKRKLKTPH